MTQSRAISRYAEAFFMFAKDEAFLDKAYSDAQRILEIFSGHRELTVFLKNPVIKADKKAAVIDKVFQKHVSSKTLAFMHLIVANSRENLLIEIFKQFNKLFFEHHHIVDAEIVTAVPIKEGTIENLKSFISKLSGYKQVELKNKVDEKIIGGFSLKYNDKLLDASVLHELDRIRKEISN
ncbi:MAG: ATP synthase F1 subunit delta [Bacteroidetes bacterium]|nr:ATP synthase F1 subunit delta [Bacteroidota bacterium]